MLRRQAQARSTEASGKVCHISATRPRPEGRQDRVHHGAQDGVTTRAFCRRRPPLSGWLVLVVPLQICSPLLAPFPLNIWGEDHAYISRDSHHSRGADQVLAHKSTEHKNTSTSGGCSSPCTDLHQPKRQSTTTHWSRVLHHNGGPNQYKSCVPCAVSSSSSSARS